MDYVYIKTAAFSGTDLTLNTIPLKVTSVGVNTSKTIPAFPIPLSGVATGESITAALDLGMATKAIDLTGVITGDYIKKTIDGVTTNLYFSAHEIAQMIHSGVDSTGFAKNQAFSELIILMPSFVKSDYTQRAGITAGDLSTATPVPFNYASRGNANRQDNRGVPRPISTFPDVSTDTGMAGFIRSFGCNFESEAVDISFTLQFEVAIIGP